MEIFEWAKVGNSGHYKLNPFYNDSINQMGFSCVARDHYGNLVAVSNKVVVVAGDKLLYQPIDYLADEVTVDRDNRVWTVTRSNKLFCFQLSGHGDNMKLTLLKSYVRPLLGSPRSITSDHDGNIWVGTRDQGLYCIQLDGLNIKSVKGLTTVDGLSENFMQYLYCDRDNNIWACSPSGLDKVKMENDHFLVENVTGSNNLYIPISKIQQTARGLFWILSDGGVITYDPVRPPSNGWRPQLSLAERVYSNKGAVPIPSNGRLKFFQNNIAFQLAAPSFIDEKQTRFSYLLEGSGNKSWSTPSRDASINLVNLSPGEYILRAKAIFLHGRYPDIESSYSFVILPPWWQTWWFKLIMGMVILVLGFLGIRFYINRKLALQRTALEKRRAIEKERTRIATDMHDDLGAGLSQIKFLSEAIGMKKQKHLPFEEEISSIRAFSVEMIDKMGEIVWALNEKNDTLSDLLSYTRSYAVGYLEQNGVTCHFEEPEDIPQDYVSSEFRRNIYLTVKESLHNIVKHAQATEVLINVTITNSLGIQIKDNGVGFDAAQDRSFGNGLISMNARVRELKGRFEMTGNNGTEINILVPLS
jgi:signal transduction histidine kinase